MNKIKVGIIGLGEIAVRTHIPLWLEMKKDVEIAGICDTDINRLKAVSERFHLRKTFENIDHLIGSNNFDLIDICTPPAAHRALCLKVIGAGVNCMMEKPFAISVKDCDEMINFSNKYGKGIFLIHNYSFVPIVRKARELINTGKLGEVLQVHVKLSLPFVGEFDNPSHWVHNLPGGLFGELAPHPCYVLVEFLNGEITDVKSIMIKRQIDSCLFGDELAVIVSTRNAIGSFTVSLNSPTRRMTIDLIGTKLWVAVDTESQTLVRYPPISQNTAIYQRGQRALSEILQRTNCLANVSFGVTTGKYRPVVEGHKYLFKQALNALRNEGTYPISLSNIQKEVRLLETSFSSIQKAKTTCMQNV